MYKRNIKIEAIFIIIIFLFLMTGCFNPDLNDLNSNNETTKSNIVSESEGKQESSTSRNPGDSGSMDTLNDEIKASNSSESTIADNNENVTTQDNDDESPSTTVAQSESKQETINSIPVLSLEVIEG